MRGMEAPELLDVKNGKKKSEGGIIQKEVRQRREFVHPIVFFPRELEGHRPSRFKLESGAIAHPVGVSFVDREDAAREVVVDPDMVDGTKVETFKHEVLCEIVSRRTSESFRFFLAGAEEGQVGRAEVFIFKIITNDTDQWADNTLVGNRYAFIHPTANIRERLKKS